MQAAAGRIQEANAAEGKAKLAAEARAAEAADLRRRLAEAEGRLSVDNDLQVTFHMKSRIMIWIIPSF